MSDLGKIDPDFFDEYLSPRLGASRDDVALGPKRGVDFGMIDVDGTAVVLATDPISVLPELGFDRAGRFALHIVLSDVAVSGLAPSHLAISFSLPPEISDEEFAELWAAIDDEAGALGISIVTGHTARYTGCSFPWVGAATALAVGDHDDVVRPDGAQAGDTVLVTKGPAVEATGLLTTLFGDRMALSKETLDEARARLDETRTVRDARAIVDASGVDGDARAVADAGGVTAMHDATEGGLQGALCEVAGSAGVRIDVERDAVPLRPGVTETCEYLDIDPWHATSSGTLVVTVSESVVDDVVSALEARGTPVGVAGSVSSGEGVYLDGERIEHPRVDPSWAVYEAFATESTE